MHKISKIALAFSVLGLTSMLANVAHAGSVTNATIVQVGASNYGSASGPDPFFVYLNQNDANIGCNSNNLPVFAIDASTPSGRAMIATVLTAQATGQVVSITGTGNCNIFSVVESASIIYLP